MSFLLDTNIISERTAKRPEPEVLSWMERHDQAALFLSVLTLGEMQYGVQKLPVGSKRQTLAAYLDDIADTFSGNILAVNEHVAHRWGEVRRIAEAAKAAIPPLDAILAATADAYGLTLVTRNTKHFEGWGGPVLNPWPQSSDT